MTSLSRARARLEHVTGLSAIMDAAYDAFEDLLAVIREHEDPASSLFAAFMFAAASAADGRDAILFAPSLPPTGNGDRLTALAGAGAEISLEEVADAAAGLGHLLAGRLLEAGQAAADPGDRSACLGAARCAENICGLLRRSGP
ncbi:MAG TPA: hypothetical protein VMV92_43885 [Streptosporangiaceae bacterium]|nr:hypothetical protein [Streptosporangiaceae bacterium]